MVITGAVEGVIVKAFGQETKAIAPPLHAFVKVMVPLYVDADAVGGITMATATGDDVTVDENAVVGTSKNPSELAVGFQSIV